MMIAIDAMSKAMILVTNNDKQFNWVSKLEVENWVKVNQGPNI